MKIRILSDLHTEFTPFLFEDDEKYLDETLVLAGDIFMLLSEKKEHIRRHLDNYCSKFRHVIYVPGNHEYYHTSLVNGEKFFKKLYRMYENLHTLNNEVVCLDGVWFIGSTLWSKISIENEFLISNSIGDYSYIDGFSPELSTDISLESIDYIQKTIKRLNIPKEKLVIVTHHGPSRKSVHPMYANSQINDAFVSDYDYAVAETGAKFWIHGHTHSSMNYFIENTNVLTNPRGYSGYRFGDGQENLDFDPNFTIEI